MVPPHFCPSRSKVLKRSGRLKIRVSPWDAYRSQPAVCGAPYRKWRRPYRSQSQWTASSGPKPPLSATSL